MSESTQSEKNALEEMGQQKDQLLQLKEAELLRNVQLKDTEVQKQDIQLAEIHQELIQVQVRTCRTMIWINDHSRTSLLWTPLES